jgi:hypothetical protein
VDFCGVASVLSSKKYELIAPPTPTHQCLRPSQPSSGYLSLLEKLGLLSHYAFNKAHIFSIWKLEIT